MPTLRQSLGSGVAGLAAALLLAAPAHAAIEHSTVHGSPGPDRFSVRASFDAAIAIADLVEGGPFSASGGCVQDSFTRAYCATGPNGLRLELGAGDDRFEVAAAAAGAPSPSYAITVDGGAGVDRIAGGLGDDLIEARDGEVDTVDCGPGADRVVADTADVVAADCETVERPVVVREPEPQPPVGGETPTPPALVPPGPPTQSTPPPAPAAKVVLSLAGRAPKLAVALRRGLPVTVRGASGTVRLRATITAKTARGAGLGRKPLVVASARLTARGGRAATVRLRFTKAARTRLAKLRTLPLTLTAGGGVSAKVVLKR
ncbi:hypothetical protein VSS74_00210 [Conexibacter stalactiti]|uniref:Uncharacterized protein n=1 Tax=Conexibacter stalactiti TaxID=1940611 RepID=A0ABU4HHI4_9ACTN|nr:hypothetical protein [Conexibacter stalactiti]MDW5592737.1 hypothetical protein [Conexibacter stalactiti]MEC5033378.1 hypothetical protein [Conexibacter stalactiti]